MNVLLVLHTDENQHLVLPDVAKELNVLGVRSRTLWDVEANLKHRLWTLGQTTAVVSFLGLKKFKPGWATLWQQEQLTKIGEYEILCRAGIPTPKTKPLYQDSEPDLSDFDEYVVVKPARGGCGAFARIMRRGKARWRPLEVDCIGSGVNDALIVQEYIHTGPWPTSYRVATVFGEPIYALRIMADRKRRPMEYVKERVDAHMFAGHSIVASSKGCTMDAHVPDDVIDFARRVHLAFPTIPLLGTDIVREENTGTLYALEVNANGWTFHLANKLKEEIQRDFGVDLYSQFGGPKAIARGILNRLSWNSEGVHAALRLVEGVAAQDRFEESDNEHTAHTASR